MSYTKGQREFVLVISIQIVATNWQGDDVVSVSGLCLMALTSVVAAIQPPAEGHLQKRNKGFYCNVFNSDRNLAGGRADLTVYAFYYHHEDYQVAEYNLGDFNSSIAEF